MGRKKDTVTWVTKPYVEFAPDGRRNTAYQGVPNKGKNLQSPRIPRIPVAVNLFPNIPERTSQEWQNIYDEVTEERNKNYNNGKSWYDYSPEEKARSRELNLEQLSASLMRDVTGKNEEFGVNNPYVEPATIRDYVHTYQRTVNVHNDIVNNSGKVPDEYKECIQAGKQFIKDNIIIDNESSSITLYKKKEPWLWHKMQRDQMEFEQRNNY